MKVDPRSGLLQGVRYRPSPNCDDRPPGSTVDLVVVHGISLPPGEFGGPWIDHLFTNRLDPHAHPYFLEIHGLRVSSHLLVRRDGTAVQFVPLHRRAWHAGPSAYRGREQCNDYSVGVEVEGTDALPYEPVQYETLARLLHAIMECFPAVTPARVVGHADVSPGRKSDPGPAFDWKLLASLLHHAG